jgi:DNA-binding transcriptional MerR regulator
MTTLIPDRRVAERYGVCVRTLRRWDATPGLDFPAPLSIRRRRYRDAAALDQWDLINSRRAAERLSDSAKAATKNKAEGQQDRAAESQHHGGPAPVREI